MVQTDLTKTEVVVTKREDDTLTDKYGETFQSKILRLFLTDSSFLVSSMSGLTVDNFSVFHGYIYNIIVKYFTYYNTLPTKDILIAIIKKDKKYDFSLLEELINEITEQDEQAISTEFYKTELKGFILDNRVKNAFFNSIDLFNSGKYREIVECLSDAMKETIDVNKMGFNIFDCDLDNEEELCKIETPFKPINKILHGGLGKGELGLVMGGTGAGKSWFLQTISIHAFKQNHNVIYYTLEMNPIDVVRRFVSIYFGMQADEVTSADIKRMKEDHNRKGNTSKFFIQWYPTKTCSIFDIKDHLNYLKTNMKFTPDVVAIDYADLMRPRFKRDTKRYELTEIYEDIRGLAGSENFVSWTVSQVNRSGYNKDLITVEDIAEGFDKASICDFVLSIAKPVKDRITNSGTAFVTKNRRGKEALKWEITFNLDIGQISLSDKYDNGEISTPLELDKKTKPKEKAVVLDLDEETNKFLDDYL